MIRRAAPTDVASIQDVERSAAALFVGTHMDFAASHAPNDSPDLLAAIDRELLWVATAEIAVVGFVLAEPCPSGLYVRELAVAAPCQRQGHGRALMATVEAAARQRGDRRLLLTTDRTLAWNAPFYARLGYRIVEGESIPVDVQRRLDGQFAAGFDPAQRCAMVLDLA